MGGGGGGGMDSTHGWDTEVTRGGNMEGTCVCSSLLGPAFGLDVHRPGLVPSCFWMIPRGRAGSRGR